LFFNVMRRSWVAESSESLPRMQYMNRRHYPQIINWGTFFTSLLNLFDLSLHFHMYVSDITKFFRAGGLSSMRSSSRNKHTSSPWPWSNPTDQKLHRILPFLCSQDPHNSLSRWITSMHALFFASHRCTCIYLYSKEKTRKELVGTIMRDLDGCQQLTRNLQIQFLGLIHSHKIANDSMMFGNWSIVFFCFQGSLGFWLTEI
jgi:hypothetical protein